VRLATGPLTKLPTVALRVANVVAAATGVAIAFFLGATLAFCLGRKPEVPGMSFSGG
jgi:hypothetical protein